jgi:hypothetical protein
MDFDISNHRTRLFGVAVALNCPVRAKIFPSICALRNNKLPHEVDKRFEGILAASLSSNEYSSNVAHFSPGFSGVIESMDLEIGCLVDAALAGWRNSRLSSSSSLSDSF